MAVTHNTYPGLVIFNTSAVLTSTNPVLKKGQIGKETDTNRYKTGDGVSTWSQLTYAEWGYEIIEAAGTDTYTGTFSSPVFLTYFPLQRIRVRFTNANTGACTINLSSNGAKAIKKNVSSSLVSGDIIAGGIYTLHYDGTNFQIENGVGTTGISPMTTLGDIIYGGVAGAMTRLPGNSTNSQLFLASTGAAGSALAPSWQPIPALGVLVYYWTKTASDIATYYKELPTNYTGTDTIANAGVINGQLLATFATDPSNPNRTFIPDGQYSCHIHAAKTAGTKNAQLYSEIWEVNAAGVDIAKIVTLGTSVVLTGASSEYSIATSLSSNYVMASTASRIVTKVYATITGGGAAPDITLYMSPTQDSRTNLPAPIIDITNYVPYTGAITTVNLNSQSLITTGTISAVGFRISGGATSGTILRGDGTNYVASTATYPNTATTGDLIYASGANAYANLAGVAVGKYLQAGGVGTAPAWSTATLPSTATGTGTILRADGTNWVATTNTYPTTTGVGQILYATSANVISSASDFVRLTTGEFIIGGTAVISGEYVSIQKASNSAIGERIYNSTSGTAGSSFYIAQANTTTAQLYALSPSYTTSGILVQDSAVLASGSATAGGLNVGSIGNYQASIWTNNTKRIGVSNAGVVTIVNLSTDGPVYTSGGTGQLNSEAQLGLARGGTNADLSGTGGTSQVLKQTSVGGAVTVGQLALTDISDYQRLIITGGSNITTTQATAQNITGIVTATLSANSRYTFSGYLFISCSGGGGVKFDVTLGGVAGMTIQAEYLGTTSGGSAFSSLLLLDGTLNTAVNTLGGSTIRKVFMCGEVVVGANTGTCQFRFASGTAGQTSTIYQQGSYIEFIKIA